MQSRDIQTKSSMIYSENIEGRYSISWSLSHSWRSKAVIPLGCLETSATLEKRGEESFFSAWDRFVDTWNGHGSIIDRGREMNRRGTDFRINRMSCCEFTRRSLYSSRSLDRIIPRDCERSIGLIPIGVVL